MGNLIQPYLEKYPYDVNMFEALKLLASRGADEEMRESSKDLIFCIELTVKKMKVNPQYTSEIGDFCLRMTRAAQIHGDFKIAIAEGSMSREFYESLAPLFPVYEMYERIMISFQETKRIRGKSARKGNYEDLGEFNN